MMPRSEGAGTAWQAAVDAHKARYRDRIVDAAVELAATEGASRITMARLAQHAGIGRATLYKYFADVEEALLAHVQRELDRCGDVLEAAAAPSGATGLERLRGCVAALAEYFGSGGHQHGWASLDRAELSTAANRVVTERMSRLIEPVVAVFADGVDDGSIRPGLAPQTYGPLVLKLVVSLHEELYRGSMTSEEAVEIVWQLVSTGVAAAAPQGATPDVTSDDAS
ncbi:MAG: TetR/AcrR family transcriptional regulator [Cellulomonas sp.]|uniref:TetR/AcrR family transcriptional regulator n=1 Tax=Cellulomonas sp. TaxID=40001 RepID=UPI0019DE2792|nr:TetR/AcrR family transcriptional regulator [Cellulomonas sp.]MBF0688233.1 TetR/AcrR family transcriptional regulator [Cellulomonas sp.]